METGTTPNICARGMTNPEQSLDHSPMNTQNTDHTTGAHKLYTCSFEHSGVHPYRTA